MRYNDKLNSHPGSSSQHLQTVEADSKWEKTRAGRVKEEEGEEGWREEDQEVEGLGEEKEGSAAALPHSSHSVLQL